LPVESIIIFGSYAKNQHGEWSDIDILIISDYFKGVNILDRFKFLQELKIGRIEAFAYTYE
jgi:predicted nucleotidyltransferase